MQLSLTLTTRQHQEIRRILFPGDGRESVAMLLCGRRMGKRRHRLLVREIHALPRDSYFERTRENVRWSVDAIVPLLESAEERRLTLVKVHSHPSGLQRFSETDDLGDSRLMPAIRDWFEEDFCHGSAIMLPDGRMFGRYVEEGGSGFLQPMHLISVVGDELRFWFWDERERQEAVPSFARSHSQVFGEGTYNQLRRLSVAVIGCSGTGSPVIEQLARLGVGRLLLLDDDVVEKRNLNRILNATKRDADENALKVEVQAEAVRRMGLGTVVEALPINLWTPEAVEAVGECDIAFGCMDSHSGRFLLNQLATYYLLPYFDLGVGIMADPDSGKIQEVCGGIHYLIPGGTSLLSREAISMDRVDAENLAREDPEEFNKRQKEGYISGVQVNRPAVITLNMAVASLAVNELLARLHPFREEANERFHHVQLSLSSCELFSESRPEVCAGDVGKGDTEPLLGLPRLSTTLKAS